MTSRARKGFPLIIALLGLALAPVSAQIPGTGGVSTNGTVANGDCAQFSGTTGKVIASAGAACGTSSGLNQLTGDVTAGPGTGSQAATIAASAVTLAKMSNLAANSIIGNNTGAGATPIALTAAQVKTLLAIANTDVSGLGTFATQNYATPPAIGGTTPAAGSFSTLSATGGVTLSGLGGGGTLCVHASNTGVLSTAAADCGSGGSVSVTSLNPALVVNPSPGTGTFTLDLQTVANTQSGTTYAPADCSALSGKQTLLTAGTAITFTMPNVSQTGCGAHFAGSVQSATSAVTVNVTAPSTINGLSSLTIPAGQGLILYDSDGLNYTAIGRTDLGTLATQNVAAVANGGTNLASYTIGDVLYASGATTISKLADVATGQVLHSGGVGAAPAYSAIVVGDLPGSGATTVNGQSCALNSTCHIISVLTGGDANWPQATTQYAWLAGGENTGNATETSREQLAPASVTVGNANGQGGFYCHASTAPPAGQTFVITLRKNEADTTVVCTVDSTGAGSDTTHNVSFAAGDRWGMKVVSSATTGTSPLQWGLTVQQ